MKKFVVSNRVFWAGVVLASAALIGRNNGHAQGQVAAVVPAVPDVPAEIKTRKLTIVDEAGKNAITLGIANGIVEMRVGAASRTGAVALLASPKSGPIIFLQGKDKAFRTVGLEPSKDMANKGTPSE